MASSHESVAPMYRPDIDGLRGIAVIATMCFHAGIPGAGGGFAGIDIFFVVSGYVITRMILGQQAAGKIDLRKFYTRRILRLVPATIPLLLVTTSLFMLVMSEREFSVYTQSVVAMTLFFANFFFYFGSSYFDPIAETQPLLHSWSLSVEEQFYLFWPVAMLIAARWLRPPVRLTLIGIALTLSLLLLLWLHPERANAGFYMLPARMWEFFVGILVAWRKPLAIPAASRALMSGLGLVALVGFLLIIRPTGGYPNFSTVVPVLATAAIIAAGDLPADSQEQQSLVNRLLGHRWLVWVGLISYSAYLWHWPILTLARYTEVFPLEIGWRAALVLFAIPVAWGSYTWVEQPMRRLSQHRHAGRIATTVLLVSIGFSIGAAYVARDVNKQLGTSQRVSEISQELDRLATRAVTCHSWPTDQAVPDCRSAPDGAAAGEWLLVGDSHADALAQALAQTLRPHGIALTQLTQSACPTGSGFEVWLARSNFTTSACAKSNHRILKEVLPSRPIDTLVIASHWPLYGLAPGSEGARAMTVDQGRPVSLEVRLTEFLSEMRRRHGNTINVILVAPIPIPGVDVPKCVMRSERLARSTERCLVQMASAHHANVAESRAMLARVAQATGARIVDGEAAFCSGDSCRFGSAGQLWWRDDNHLSLKGAALFAQALAPQLGLGNTQ